MGNTTDTPGDTAGDTADDGVRIEGHPGEQAVAAMLAFGTDTMFTLNGGHIWPLYDGARNQGMRVVDTRHEQTATFAAEAYAKLTRKPGLAALTAGPGITNGVSAITSAWFNGTPLVVLGGRAPEGRWGAGSLQEMDHVPVVASITKSAGTVKDATQAASAVHAAATTALTPHRGPTFLDVPMDVFFKSSAGSMPRVDTTVRLGATPDPDAIAALVKLIGDAERPAFIVGSDVYWDGAWDALRAAVEHLRVPCFFNGLGRGTIPADHELAFLRTRGLLKTRADLVVVLGTPLDFRLGFGRFGDAQVAHVVDSEGQRAHHVDVPTVAGDIEATLRALADATPGRGPRRLDRRAACRRDRRQGQRRRAARLGRRADPPEPHLRRARPAAGARRGGHLRRRRLRLVRRQVRRGVRAGLLARHRALRLSGQRAGLRDRGADRATRRADRPAAR